MKFILNILGIFVIMGFMWVISFNRKAINYKQIA